MPRFHFNMRKLHDLVKDIEGMELPDLATAEREAIEDARHAMSTAILKGLDISRTSTIEICDEVGTVLLRVPFQTAIRVSD